MRKIVWLLAVSITANAVMAGLWLRHRMETPATISSIAPDSDTVSATRNVSGSSSEMAATSGANQFNGNPESVVALTSWKDIQSSELKEWIRRLHAAGCPEETVRDMILAEVNRRFAAKSRDLWPDNFSNFEFWKVQKNRFDAAEAKKQRERSRAQRDLQKEKSAMLVDLLGVDPEKQIRLEEGLDEPVNWWEQGVAFLPEEKRETVSRYLNDWQDRMSEFSTTNQGMYDAQYRAELKQLETDKMAGLAQFLTPQELRDYELRQSQIASTLSYNLQHLDINRAQYETIFDITKKYGDTIHNFGDDNNTREQREQIEKNQKNMKTEIASALGPDLGKQYERSQDYSYQQLAQTVKRYDLPADTAGKVYDFKKTAEDSATRLRTDKTLTSQQQQELLQKIRSETDTTLKQTLGDKAYKSYMRNNGWWLNSIAPPVIATQPPK